MVVIAVIKTMVVRTVVKSGGYKNISNNRSRISVSSKSGSNSSKNDSKNSSRKVVVRT